MDLKNIGKWSYLGGLVLAIVAAVAGFSASWLPTVLVALAILAGLFFMDTEEVTHAGIRYLALLAVATALDAVPTVGPYVTTVAEANARLLWPTNAHCSFGL